MKNPARVLAAALLLLVWVAPVVAAPWWEVHFTEQASNTNSAYEQEIYDFIKQANVSVWVTSYTWGNSSHNKLMLALNEQYAAGLDVRLVGDNTSAFNTYMTAGYRDLGRTDAAAADAANLQHNKFIVIDYNTSNAKVMTGSTNWTDPAYATQNNDIISINSTAIANAYGREFLELWGGSYRSGPVDQHEYTVNGHPVQVYFASEDDPGSTYLVNLLRNAQNCIYFLSFNQTLGDYATQGVALRNRGGIVEGAYETLWASSLTAYLNAGADVRQDANTDHLHHKLFIVDLKTVATGSLNHSLSSSNSTDENLIMIHDFRLAREYMKQFHFCMDQTTAGAAPTHEDASPEVVTNLTAIDNPNDAGQAIAVSWTASGASDLAGYYVYISRTAIGSVQNLVPETFVQGGATSTIVRTYNQDDAISNNTDYYIAVSAVDWHGNENYNCPTTGPVQATGLITGARPAGSIDFKDTASRITAQGSTLAAVVSNDSTAVSAIAALTIVFGNASGGTVFHPTAGGQVAPAGWTVTAVSDTAITFTASGAVSHIAAGQSETFTIEVTNPSTAGLSNAITMDVTAANGELTSGVSLSGGLLLTAAQAVPRFTLAWDTGANQRGGNASTLLVQMGNGSAASAGIREVTFDCGSGIAAFAPRGSGVQAPPTGWTVTGAGSVLTFTASDSAYYVDPGETRAFTLAVTNPGINRTSTAITATSTDQSGLAISGNNVGTLRVLATDGVVINEIMYNPVGTDALFEFVELYNRTPVTVELGSWVFSAGGVQTALPAATTLAPYQYLVIASTKERGTVGDMFFESYSSRYGNQDGLWTPGQGISGEDYDVIDATDFNLNDDADYVTLTSSDSTFTVTVRYNDALLAWQRADGSGASLEKRDPLIDDVGTAGTDGLNWGAQQVTVAYPYGTAGLVNSISVSSVPPVTGLAVRSAGASSVSLGWTALSGYTTFGSYVIYYSTTSPVTASSSVWNAGNDPNLAAMATTSTTVTGLAPNTTYYFRLVAQSTVSGLGDVTAANEVSALTQVSAQVTVNYLYDGVRYVTDYEGSAILRDVGVMASLRLASVPADSNSVLAWYDVGADPDGPGGSNTTDRFARAAGNGTTWDVMIPGNDLEITDGAQVRFLVAVDGRNHFNSGVPWKYTVDGGISASFTDLAAVGVGQGRMELRWTPVTNIPDFGQYRVYYTAGVDSITGSSLNWDATNDYMLSYPNTGATVVTGLSPNTAYRFRIVAVDRYGNESDLASSNEPAGTTLAGTVIITEFAPEGDTFSAALPWAELYCVSGSQDLTNWNLTDLDGNTVPVGAVTLSAGQYRVVYFSDSLFFAGDDQLALDVNGDTRDGGYADALVWTNSNGAYSADALADVRALGPGNWQFANSFVTGQEAVAEDFSVPYPAGQFASLVRAVIDGYRDDNNYYDWRLQYTPSKGLANGITTVSLLAFSDGTNDGYPDGYAYFQDTAVTVRFGFGTAPTDTARVRVCYNLDAVPTGNPAGTDSWVTMAPQGDYLTWSCTIPGTGNPVANSGRRRTFIVVADGIPYYPDNVPGAVWSFRLDGVAPPAVAGCHVLSTTQTAAMAGWSPLSNLSDFASYRVYYAALPGPVTTASAYIDKRTVPELGYISTAGAAVTGLVAGGSYVLAVAAADARGNLSPLSAADTAFLLPALSVSSLSVADSAGNSVSAGFDGTDRLRGTSLTVTAWFSDSPAAIPVLWQDGRMTPDGPGGTNLLDRSETMSCVGDPRAWTATIPYTDASVVNDTTLQMVFSVGSTVIRNSGTPFKVYIDTTAAPMTAPAGFNVVGTVAGGAVLSWTPPGVTTGFAGYRVYYAVAPGPVTAASAYVGPAQYAALGSASTSGVMLTGLTAGCSYVMAVAAADAIGNVTALSNPDTALTLVSQQVNNFTLADTAGNSLTGMFDGSGKLRGTAITVTVQLSEAATDTPVIWFDVGAVPDGPGGANAADRACTLAAQGDASRWSGVIPVSDPEITVHGALVQLVLATSGVVLNNTGLPWRYTADAQSGAAPLMMGVAGEAQSTSVTVSWAPVTADDFGAYRVYYAKGATVTKSDSAWTTAKDAGLASRLMSGTSVRGLDTSSIYSFAVAWRDALGNESALSDTRALLTNNAVPADDPADDGLNVAHYLDGTESLRDTDITITMLLVSPPRDAGSAWIYYDVGGFPDGPGGGNTDERRVPLVDSPDGNPLTWSAVIPGSDPEIADGALVRYLGAADGYCLTNMGTPYAFRIDGSAPPAAGNPMTMDDGSLVVVMWSPVSAPDFAGYRIYHNTNWPARAGQRRDKVADPTLASALTSGATLTGFDPAQNYYLNIATVDAVGNERLLANDIILYRRAPGAAAVVTYLQGAAGGFGEVYAGDSWPLAVRVADATELPAPGENVTFTVTAGAGTLAGGSTRTVATALDGVARVTLVTGADPALTGQVRATVGALAPVDIVVRATRRSPAALRLTVPATATTDETVTVAVEALTAAGAVDAAWSGEVALTAAERGGVAGTLRGAGTVTLAGGRGAWQLGNREAEMVELTASSVTLVQVRTTAVLSFMAGSPAQLRLSAPVAVVAGVAAPVTVAVLDAGGNPCAADSVTTVQVSVDGSAYASLGGAQRVTGGQLALTVTDLASETVTLRAASAGLPAAAAVMAVTPAAAVKAVATGWINAPAGTAASVTVEIRDAYGNRVTGDNGRVVTLGVTGTAQVLTANPTVNGRASFTVADSFAGDVTLTPATPGLVALAGLAHFYSGTDTLSAAVALVPAVAVLTATAGEPLAVAVRVLDGRGQVDVADSGRIITVAGGAIGPATGSTAAGVATVTLAETRAGTLVLTATAAGLRPCTMTMTVQPGVGARVAAAAPVAVDCNLPATVILTLTDAYGNTVNDNVSRADLAPERGSVGNAGPLAGGTRALTVATPAAGPLALVPLVGSLRGETLTITVNSGPAYRIAAVAAETAPVGVPVAIILEVQDAGGNCVVTDNGRRVALQLDGSATSPAQYGTPVTTAGRLLTTLTASAPGVVTVNPLASGLMAVADSVLVLAPAGPSPVQPAAAVVALAGAAVASIDDTVTIRVEVRDAGGNLCAGDTTTVVRLEVSAGVRVAEAQPRMVSGGFALFHIGTDVLGNLTVIPRAGALPATAATVEFRAGVPARVRLAGAAGAVTGGSVPLALTVEDRLGNVLDGSWPVTLAVTGSAQAPAAVTAAAGRAALTVTDAAAETVTVTATVPGLAPAVHTLVFAASTPQRLILTVPATAVFGAALPVRADIFDALGNPVAGAGAVTFTVDRGGVTPAAATLAGSSLTANLTLSASGAVRLTATWSGLADTGMLMVLVPPATAATVQATENVAVRLPAGAVADSCYVTVRTGVAAAAGLSLGGVVGEPVELFVIKATGNDTLTANFAELVTVEVAYADADQNGIVDGTALEERTLQLYRWENNAWVLVADGGRNAADAARNVVVADLRHFSQYAIRVSADTGPAGGEIVAYPNPWKSSVNASQRIVFANVPTGVPVRLRIYSIGGEKVADEELTLGANQRMEWTLCNDGGEAVASGIYLYVISGGGVEKVGKVAVIR